MGALLFQAREIIFQVQTKMNNEKIARRKNKLSNSQNIFF
jgi:ribosome-associated protein YbcJ (S4-like RNA binding protein)